MITRRNFVSEIVLLILTVGIPVRVRAESEDEVLQFTWRVPEAHRTAVEEALRDPAAQFEGVAREDSKGAAVLIFAGVILLTYLAKAVLALRRDIVYGGVVIDTRGQTVVIDTDKSLPGGTILVVGKDSTQMFERDEIADPTQLVKELSRVK